MKFFLIYFGILGWVFFLIKCYFTANLRKIVTEDAAIIKKLVTNCDIYLQLIEKLVEKRNSDSIEGDEWKRDL